MTRIETSRKSSFATYLFFFSLISSILCTSSTHAQSNSDSILTNPTLPNVVQYALKRQPAVLQSLLDQEITDFQIKSRLADWYPQINFNYLYQHNFKVQVAVINGNPTRLGVNNTSALQFSASQNIFNRDVLLASRTKGDVRQQALQLTEDTKIGVVSNVSRAFYALV